MSKQYASLIYHFDPFVSEAARRAFEKVLDVGCGGRKFPGAVGIDKVEDAGVDIVWDLDSYPWPLQDNSFDLIILQHSLEHLENIVKVMEEIHRIGKNGARVLMQVPFFRNLDAVRDVTHKHFFTLDSIDYFVEGSKSFDYHYSKAKFELAGKWLGWPGPSKNPFRGFLKQIINRWPKFYEQYLSVVYPVKNIAWEITIKK